MYVCMYVFTMTDVCIRCLLMQFEHDVYLPTDEPHGTIEAVIRRKNEFEGSSKL
jgi:hypothetical protein